MLPDYDVRQQAFTEERLRMKDIGPYSNYPLTVRLELANTPGIFAKVAAVLGLGNLGPEAALPVMGGKAALFK
jgi:malic enzyme